MSITIKRIVARFNVGRVDVTPGADDQVHEDDLFDFFVRHTAGDWGEVDDEDRQANDEALVNGRRLLSAYTDRYGVRLWIITEADRSATTLLLPEEY